MKSMAMKKLVMNCTAMKEYSMLKFMLAMKKYDKENTNFIAVAMKQIGDEKVGDELYGDERIIYAEIYCWR